VGIGTNSPSGNVEILSGSSTLDTNNLVLSNSYNNYSNQYTGSSSILAKGYAYSSYNLQNIGKIQFALDNAFSGAWASSVRFYTSDGSGTNGAISERMRITGAGNVGIGTNSPSRLLELYNSGSPVLRFNDSIATWDMRTNGFSGDALQFDYNGTRKVGFDSSGNMTLTATTPSSSTTSGALQVAGGVGIGGNLNTGTSDASAPIVYNSSNSRYTMLGKIISSANNGTAQTLATFSPSYQDTIMIKVVIHGTQAISNNAWEDVGYASYSRISGSYNASTATVTNVTNISGTHNLGTLSWLNVSSGTPILQYTQSHNGYAIESLDVYVTGKDGFGCTFNTALISQ
jgi:hypothetical protein